MLIDGEEQEHGGRWGECMGITDVKEKCEDCYILC